jgi:hypothetical protein
VDASTPERFDEFSVFEGENTDVEPVPVDSVQQAQQRCLGTPELRGVVHDVHPMRAHVRKSSDRASTWQHARTLDPG